MRRVPWRASSGAEGLAGWLPLPTGGGGGKAEAGGPSPQEACSTPSPLQAALLDGVAQPRVSLVCPLSKCLSRRRDKNHGRAAPLVSGSRRAFMKSRLFRSASRSDI